MTTATIADGYTPIPNTKIAAIVTYLRMSAAHSRPSAPQIPAGAGQLGLDLLRGEDVARYRALFRAVGEPWMWFSRLAMAETTLAAILDDPRVEARAVTRDGADIGILEVDFRNPDEAELAFVGLVPGAVGQGLGRWLIETGIAIGFSRSAPQLMLHTCTLDHPSALPAYRRAGFVPYARALELADDPRIASTMPRDAGPLCPLLG